MKKILLLNITLLGSTFSLASPVQTNNPGLNGQMQKMPLTLTIYKSSWSRWSWNEAGWFSKWVQPPLWCLVPIQLDGTYVHSESFLFNLWLCHFCDHFYIFPLVDNSLRSRMSFLRIRWKMTSLLQIGHALFWIMLSPHCNRVIAS